MPTDPLVSGVVGAVIGALATNVVRHYLDRRTKTVDVTAERRWEARERVSQKLAVIFNPYTAESTKTMQDVQRLRAEWAPEGYLLDILNDPEVGRALTRIVNEYLDALVHHINGTIDAVNLAEKRGYAWRDARDRLEQYVKS